MWLDNNYSEHWPSQEEQQASDTEERFISHRQGGSKVEKGATSSCQHELQCSHAFYDLVTTYVLP